MRVPSAFFAFIVLLSPVRGQGFECYPPGPLPANPVLSCEGLIWNGLGAASITSTASCGFPTLGTKYMTATASGPIAVPIGGPLPRPFAGGATEVRVPIPFGATIVAFGWDFYNYECPSDALHNDGVSIDIVDATGALVMNLAYGDTASVEGVACVAALDRCGGPVSDIGPAAGPNPTILLLPPLPSCAYISIVVWDGGDTLNASTFNMDPILFDVGGPWCPPPCFAPPAPGAPALTWSGPNPGCIIGWITGMPAGAAYIMPVSITAGFFPSGWFYGVSIEVSQLAFQVNFGPPFAGSVGAGACDTGTVSMGPICGLPSGLTLYSVAVANTGPGPASVTPPVAFTIP